MASSATGKSHVLSNGAAAVGGEEEVPTPVPVGRSVDYPPCSQT